MVQQSPVTIAAIPILLVDDDPGVREGLAFALSDAGWMVTAVGSPLLALLAAIRIGPHAAVVDVHLGPLEGLALAGHLRALCPGLPIAAITGRPGPGLDRAIGNGLVDGTLTKPFATDDLDRLLRRIARPPHAQTTGSVPGDVRRLAEMGLDPSARHIAIQELGAPLSDAETGAWHFGLRCALGIGDDDGLTAVAGAARS
ncbi:MAG: hypothetical protein RLZZ127_1450 [Planctomycetota bacterium]